MKPYHKLRTALFAADISQLELAEVQQCHFTHMSRLMLGKAEWRLGECYKVLELIGEPPEKLTEYFPPNPWGEVKASGE